MASIAIKINLTKNNKEEMIKVVLNFKNHLTIQNQIMLTAISSFELVFNVDCNFISAAAFFAAMKFCSNAAEFIFKSGAKDFCCDNLSGGGGGMNGKGIEGLMLCCSAKFSLADVELLFCKKFSSFHL